MNDEFPENLCGTVEFLETQKNTLGNRLTLLEDRVLALENKSIHEANPQYLKSAVEKLQKKYKINFDIHKKIIFINDKTLKTFRQTNVLIYDFFEYIHDKRNETVSFHEIGKNIGYEDITCKKIHGFIHDLNFDKNIKRDFFSINSKKRTLLFRDEVISNNKELAENFA